MERRGNGASSFGVGFDRRPGTNSVVPRQTAKTGLGRRHQGRREKSSKSGKAGDTVAPVQRPKFRRPARSVATPGAGQLLCRLPLFIDRPDASKQAGPQLAGLTNPVAGSPCRGPASRKLHATYQAYLGCSAFDPPRAELGQTPEFDAGATKALGTADFFEE
ncbi:hypothetical protein KM043_009490 [Ampulex compressa]|nr:hypothetical protein KM043_009490 [Ampulex compressa]